MTKPPRFHDIVWSWQSNDSDIRTAYLRMDGRITFAALIEHLKEVAPDHDLNDLTINFGTIMWLRPANDEELAVRNEWRAKARARGEEWERKTYQRLKEKFGDV